jgi:hypothetical protein
MRILKSRLPRFIMAFLIVGSMLKGWTLAADTLNLAPPTDQSLISIFQNHHGAFEELRQMAIEDLGKASYISESDVEGRITDTRKQTYRLLLREIYPGLAVAADYDKSVTFRFATEGSAISPSWMKGIVYDPASSEKAGRVIQNLDKANILPPGMYLRPIAPNWFIVYSRTED